MSCQYSYMPNSVNIFVTQYTDIFDNIVSSNSLDNIRFFSECLKLKFWSYLTNCHLMIPVSFFNQCYLQCLVFVFLFWPTNPSNSYMSNITGLTKAMSQLKVSTQIWTLKSKKTYCNTVTSTYYLTYGSMYSIKHVRKRHWRLLSVYYN